ncbi:MAG: tRNA epoxyqueuosine(34) reductase QueG [Candidatus Eremiobacteraeota bacterium]|nr:tRNA epoxyqueuosine(34) reductase QueG [Candidatus Eremiobacteraeota bacterium]
MISATASRKERIVAHAKEIGFDLVGVAGAQPFLSDERIFKERVASGLLADWHYPDQIVERTCRPAQVLPGAKSIICTATSYLTDAVPHDPYAPGLRGAISSYAWGKDYHHVIGARLRELAAFIEREFEGERCIACVDTGPMVDRAAAVRAGIGWFGKNANLLTRDFGSWVFLGELITTLELPTDEPLVKSCGQCVECIARCPTGAIGANGSVDARRCISDLTQSRRPVPRELRAAIGNRLWGCDDCQTVCPVNERKELAAKSRARAEFEPLPQIGTSMDLVAVLGMTTSQFRAWFGPTAMAWRGKAALQRNAAVALGNSRDSRAVEPLIAALSDRKALVRGHAAWALGQLHNQCRGALAQRAQASLHSLLARERDEWVREEATAALEMLDDERQELA